MKKVLFGFLVILLVLAGLVFYQRQKVVNSLAQLLKGKTYSSYGVKIQIPPTKGSVTGWIKPYVNLPRVIVDFSAWGLQVPIQLENAVAFRDLWGSSAVLIEVPRDLQPAAGLTVSKLFVELGLDEKIHVLGAESLTYQEKDAPQSEKLVLMEPQWVLSGKADQTTERLALKLQGLKWKERRDNLVLAPFELGVEFGGQGPRREWTLYSLGAGGWFQEEQGEDSSQASAERGEIGGWKVYHRGLVQSVPLEEVFEKVKAVGQAGVNFFPKLVALVQDLQLEFTSHEFSWDGIKIVGAEGQELLKMAPLMGQGKAQLQDRSLSYEGEVNLKELNGLIEKYPLYLENFQLTQNLIYEDVSYAELLNYVSDYFKAYYTPLLFGISTASKPSSQFPNLAYSYIALYPNQMHFEAKLAKLEYETDSSQAKHRDLSLVYYIKPRELAYQISDQFSFAFKEGSKNKNIEQGKGMLKLASQFPMDGLIRFSRQALRNPGQAADLSQIFGEERDGLTLQFFLDLGANYFLVDLDAKLSLPLGPVVKGLDLTKLAGEQELENLSNAVVTQFAQQGDFRFALKVERLSKLQAFLEEMKSGTSLGMVALAPYAQMDGDQDTMTMLLEFKGGKVLVNGNPNESLQKIIEPFFQKAGKSLPSKGESNHESK